MQHDNTEMKTRKREKNSLYSLFIMIFIIFVTVCFIQFATDINVTTVNTEAYRLFKSLAYNRKHRTAQLQNGNSKDSSDVTTRTIVAQDRNIDVNQKNIPDEKKDTSGLSNDKAQNEDYRQEIEIHPPEAGQDKSVHSQLGSIDTKQNVKLVHSSYNEALKEEMFNESNILKPERKISKGGKRPNYCPLWPSELSKYSIR